MRLPIFVGEQQHWGEIRQVNMIDPETDLPVVAYKGTAEGSKVEAVAESPDLVYQLLVADLTP